MNQADLKQSLAQSLVVGLKGYEPTKQELEMVTDHGFGGVILFKRNIKNPDQVWELNNTLRKAAWEAGRPPLFVMVDQEGGTVARLKEPFTHALDLSYFGDKGEKAIYAHGQKMALELLAAGFNWDLAPVLDVHAIENGVMEKRSLGKDPKLVAFLGAQFINAMQNAGLLACGKHFPGLGRTTLDTHKKRPIIDLSLDELEQMEFKPFYEASKNHVAGIMVCHGVFTALDPNLPASLSPKVIKDFLRQKIGYKGLILSDDLEMGALSANLAPDEAAVKAYMAGNDLLLVCEQAEYALKALDTLIENANHGLIPLKRIEQSMTRILSVKRRLSPLSPPLAGLHRLLDL